MIRKSLYDIKIADVHAFVAEQYPEGKTLEYKRDFYRLSGGTPDQDRKQHVELLKDISSFANTMGGDLMIGIDESAGLPTNVCGIPVSDLDALKLRITDIVDRGLQPRIAISIHGVESAPGQYVLIIRILRSMVGPHRVVFRGENGEFFARSSAGVVRMDTSDLRQAFNLSGSIYSQIRDFRKERVTEIAAGRTPIVVAGKTKLICHLIPLESYAARINIEPAVFDTFTLWPFSSVSGCTPRFNMDGMVSFDNGHGERPSTGYVQIYRNGIIEAVADNVVFFHPQDPEKKRPYFSTDVIGKLLKYLPTYLAALKNLSIPPPIWCYITLIGMEGVEMYPESSLSGGNPIDRDVLYMPEIEITEPAPKCDALLKPVFDMLWNAAGFRRCPKYNGDDYMGN